MCIERAAGRNATPLMPLKIPGKIKAAFIPAPCYSEHKAGYNGNRGIVLFDPFCRTHIVFNDALPIPLTLLAAAETKLYEPGKPPAFP